MRLQAVSVLFRQTRTPRRGPMGTVFSRALPAAFALFAAAAPLCVVAQEGPSLSLKDLVL